MGSAKSRRAWTDPMEKMYAEYRLHPITPYRDRHYRPKVRHGWWFSIVRGAINGGYHPDNYRTLGVRIVASGGRDWEGSCYTVTLAHFVHVAGGGWTLDGVTYPTLLRAVRAWMARQ